MARKEIAVKKDVVIAQRRGASAAEWHDQQGQASSPAVIGLAECGEGMEGSRRVPPLWLWSDRILVGRF